MEDRPMSETQSSSSNRYAAEPRERASSESTFPERLHRAGRATMGLRFWWMADAACWDTRGLWAVGGRLLVTWAVRGRNVQKAA
jgi:hypothetical protein